MKIGKAKPKGVAGVTPARKTGDKEKPEGYVCGRPTNYRPEYCQSIIEYFAAPESWDINVDAKGSAKAIPKSKIPTVERWCYSIGVHSRTLDDWQARYPEFRDAYQTARGLQQAFAIELAAAGIGTSMMNTFMQVKHDWRVAREDEEHISEPIQKVVVEVVSADKHKGD
ncbi:hypothetical protein ACDF60_004526 [Salmonella enterica]